MRTHAVILEQLEAGFDDESETYAWHVAGLVWRRRSSLLVEVRRRRRVRTMKSKHAELQLLYSRAVTPYFDLQAGVRQSYLDGEDRTDLVLGVQGLAPYWFEVGAAAFVSD